jgi:hypothetical protein
MIEPVYEKINFNLKEETIKEQIKAEVKTEVLSENVQSILAVSPFVTVSVNEITDGKIVYGGKVIFYISYVDTDGALKKCECGNEFVGEIKNPLVKKGCREYITAEAEKVEADISGLKLSAGAYINVCLNLTDCAEISALKNGENLVVEEKDLTKIKSLGVRRGVYPIEEEFEIGYAVEEVLFHRADAVITATQCGVGVIIVDGEVLLSAIMLQKGDKKDIIKETKTLPFRMEIECEEAMPNMYSSARVKERSFKTDVQVDAENSKSVVLVSVSLGFEGEAFALTDARVASDAFSTENEIELIKEEYPFYKTCEIRSFTGVIGGRAAVSELPVGAIIMAVGGEKATVLSETCSDGTFVVTGTLGATAFVRDGDGRVFTRKLEIPFEKSFDAGFNCLMQTATVVKVARATAKIVSLTEMDVEADLRFTVYPQEKCAVSVVKDVKFLGEKKKSDAAISIYIPTEGEELWSLSKRLNVCPETLIETNKELQFPLTGKERIVVYRRK